MEIRNINTFLKIAELGNFTQSALQLGYSQSAVTLQIQQLEKELGVLLFERIGKKVQLTEQGKIFQKYALEIKRTLQAAVDSVKTNSRPSGKLKLGVIESLHLSVMPKILREYHKLYPNVEITVLTGLNSQMFDMLAKNEIDIIYFLDVETNMREWVKVCQKKEPVVFVCSSSSHLATKKNVPMDEILNMPMILTEKNYCYRYTLEQFTAKMGIELRPFLEMGNTDKIADMVSDDLGISFLPLFCVQSYLESGQLAVIDTEDIGTDMYTQLVYHKNKYVSPQMHAFIDLMQKNL